MPLGESLATIIIPDAYTQAGQARVALEAFTGFPNTRDGAVDIGIAQLGTFPLAIIAPQGMITSGQIGVSDRQIPNGIVLNYRPEPGNEVLSIVPRVTAPKIGVDWGEVTGFEARHYSGVDASGGWETGFIAPVGMGGDYLADLRANSVNPVLLGVLVGIEGTIRGSSDIFHGFAVIPTTAAL